ncbi:catechol 2,3-dioxygenase-like lactoylglutathione lyase family enzyme [Roseiarcus fermentans]|uniref:Catechol 2,3-dioxygenase-like lactoylglutathione lyase family enzyme n=1 Tax=Roseiarcus fermentans TaxID=1473586 RepID=A0A366FRB9_9HYPH|nr:VOC family protein [Roseiarcus fermentans]RBP17117.1 catechol 2,3-dioxygenase-like lactoylglutathione lyase family enzyme [Roseiarcus fermentans]
MLDHIGIAVADFEPSKAFYEAALRPLGLSLVMSVTAEETGAGAHAGFGASDKPFFWIGTGAGPKGGTHVAFAAGTRAEVDAFHRAALAAGGRDNGPPGLRPHYHPNYYAAFVLDRDGNNIEAVCHAPA